ncbi:MAG: accessory Sec system glycosylation chaperone GtfB [Lachnospiraceae bacterium]|nr:accessory Sec system glycosylation chaperone GtfB [Lachnospiraceae bacterium]
MAEADNRSCIILLMDRYGEESKQLCYSLKRAGILYKGVVIDDDGFLEADIESPYGFFLGDYKNAKGSPGRPRYFNRVEVPKFWEISANNRSGKISDLSKERGRIFYAEPLNKRLVNAVDWLDEKGVVRSTDHYNRYGMLFSRTAFNKKGERVNRSYFSPDEKEILTENYVTGDITLNYRDRIYFFRNKTELICFYLKEAGYENCDIYYNSLSYPFFVSERMEGEHKDNILFWQEPVGNEIPGNMRMILNAPDGRTKRIMVQKRTSYEKLLRLGAKKDMLCLLGYIYPFTGKNLHGNNVLICTNSDNIACLGELVEGLPGLHFHIAALTEMSSRLMAYEDNENVTLYPGIDMIRLEGLFRKCDIYFDINHEAEIVSAIKRAFLANMLIFAFKETLHNAEFVIPSHIFTKNAPKEFITCVKDMISTEKKIDEEIEKQHEFALSEAPGSYLMIKSRNNS